MPELQRTYSPIDGRLYVERPLATADELADILAATRGAQRQLAKMPLAERCAAARAFAEGMCRESAQAAEEITYQMGRPLSQSPGEIRGTIERTLAMAAVAPEALAPVVPSAKPGFERSITREPLGVVLVLAPWNYPLLTAVNAVIPALLCGNAVILKHSDQTPLCSERFASALASVGLPSGSVHSIVADHATVGALIRRRAVDYVAFTGSVAGGDAISRASGEARVGLGLELGGKDAAYVCSDAELARAVEGLVDGAFFNSGQSCCGVERIYVARDRYDQFVNDFVQRTLDYELGNPLEPGVTLGPLVRQKAADHVRRQIAEAVAGGAKALVDERLFPASDPSTPYLAPQVLVDVRESMAVQREESFGPVVTISPVASEEEAIARINDSRYGLTASLWTSDVQRARRLAPRLEVGTVFMNRCDYLDPELAWAGVKDSGRGCTLSKLGFEALTRPKSLHFRLG